MTKSYNLKVKDIYKETDDCSVISFDIPNDLKDKFTFKQGQYLTLIKNINGEEIRRSYSLCSAPYEDAWSVAVKKIEKGKFSTFANDILEKGDVIEVMPPDGKFFVEVDITKPKNYVAFVAGSGITPVISIIKTHLAEEPESTFHLFYINKNSQSVIFKNELNELVKKYPNKFSIYYLFTRENTENELLNGRFSEEKLRKISSKIISFNKVNECFICGPQEMIFLIKDTLSEMGMNEKNIHFELFEAVTISEKEKNKIDAVNAEVTIIVDDEELTFTVPKGKNILEIAEEQDADVPFSCKGGVCCTCKAKVIEGTVEMIVNYALDELDIKNKLVLTCQAVPTSKKVVVDYDDVY